MIEKQVLFVIFADDSRRLLRPLLSNLQSYTFFKNPINGKQIVKNSKFA
jgi:hypothetical protein